jgi:Cd2+/Zn2+-exporting ATPase
MVSKYNVANLDCANCAAKIESQLKKHAAVRSVSLDFVTLTLHIDTDDIETIRREIKKIEPQVELTLPQPETASQPKPGQKHFSLKKDIITGSVAGLLFLVQLLFEQHLHHTPGSIAEYAVCLTAYLLAGWNVLSGAVRTIRKGQLFDENVLMSLATIGAFAIHALSEAVGVMIFFKIGEMLQNLAVARSRKSIQALLQIRPGSANLKTAQGLKKVSPEEVRIGEMVVVKAGEKIPLDGLVTEGTSLVNTSALTGESVPATVEPGDMVLAGEINTSGLLTIKVTRAFADSEIARILDLVENANARKAKTEQFITQFARYYTPAVVFLALGVAILPPLLYAGQAFGTWLYRALVLLVISCPCALLTSIPLGYFGGIGGASHRGILVKGANCLDALAKVTTVVFDKTGTLTKGIFSVKEIIPSNGFTKEEILSFAATAEAYSNHPIATSIREAAHRREVCRDGAEVLAHQEIAGHGVIVKTREHTILVGNDLLMQREQIAHEGCTSLETVAHVSVDGEYAGQIIIGDELKEDAPNAIAMLRKEGVSTIVMLTGDSHDAAQITANKLGLDAFHAGLLPEHKVNILEHLIHTRHTEGTVVFVGDGINDAPVLARADIGIAMGALGSDAAIETADVVLMTDHPSRTAEAIRISKRTRAIVWQNILFALTVKTLFLTLGIFGVAGMWEAVFADMGTALLAVLNATRALGTKSV